MKKIHRIILCLLIVELVVVIPIIDNLLYGHSDPFVSHVITPSYLLSKMGNLNDVNQYLSQEYHNINAKAWTWQISTSYLIRDYVVGAPLLLYTTGTVSSIDFKVLGYSPLLYFVYVLLFITIFLKITNDPMEGLLGWHKLVLILIMVSVGLDFLTTYVFAHFIGFQYHAVALVMYLSIILSFILYLQSEQRQSKILIPTIILYLGLLITHYRFPTLILGNLILYALFFGILWNYTTDIVYRRLSKALLMISTVLFLLLYFQPFYWTQLKYKGSYYLDIFFIFEYLSQVLSGQREAGSGFANLGSISLIQKYNVYLMFLSWGLTVFILTFYTVKWSKVRKRAFSGEMFFLWSAGSTLIYDLTYFLHYHGLTGLSIYEAWIVAVALIPFFKRSLRLVESKFALSLSISFMLVFSSSFIVGGSFSLYQEVIYPAHPDPPRYQADASLPFVWTVIAPTSANRGIVIGSSFPVSAELYEQTAKYRNNLLLNIGSARIVNEVLEYNQNRDVNSFLRQIQQRYDYLLITQYEEKHGLSADVLGLRTCLLPLGIKISKERFNQIYNSDFVSILKA